MIGVITRDFIRNCGDHRQLIADSQSRQSVSLQAIRQWLAAYNGCGHGSTLQSMAHSQIPFVKYMGMARVHNRLD